MGRMNKMFKNDVSSGGLVHGGHGINHSTVLAATSADAISPLNPGKFTAADRSVPIIEKPRYFTEEEADAMKTLAKEKTDGARQAKRA